MKCQHMACHQCEDAGLAAMRDEVEQLRRERDEQIAEAASWRATARDKGYSAREVAKERDEARAEVERLRKQLAAVGATTAPLYTSQERDVLIQERDEARAEVERLLAERRQLRARLVECRPWVGVCPWPDTPGWRDVMAVRDLADDTLREVE